MPFLKRKVVMTVYQRTFELVSLMSLVYIGWVQNVNASCFQVKEVMMEEVDGRVLK